MTLTILVHVFSSQIRALCAELGKSVILAGLAPTNEGEYDEAAIERLREKLRVRRVTVIDGISSVLAVSEHNGRVSSSVQVPEWVCEEGVH